MIAAALVAAVLTVSPGDIRVIDGDTFDVVWPVGIVRYRFPDVDAPETRNARCAVELERGRAATRRLTELVLKGDVNIRITGEFCGLRRPCADLLIDGASAIATMRAERHLRSWRHEGRRAVEPRPNWCGAG